MSTCACSPKEGLRDDSWDPQTAGLGSGLELRTKHCPAPARNASVRDWKLMNASLCASVENGRCYFKHVHEETQAYGEVGLS